jgi:Phytanoyl-CoA dioxygenase (PhyH)
MPIDADAADGAARAALFEAESLTRRGRSLEAIDLLTRVNRQVRDAEIETRLVVLRNRAYGELDRSPTPAPWPDEAPRPRGDGEPLPPIDSENLSAELVRDQILRSGCAYLPRLVPERRVDQLANGIDRAFEGARAQSKRSLDAETAPWYVRFDPPDGVKIPPKSRGWVRSGGGVWTVDSPRVMFDFLEALEEAGLRTVVRDYLGERPAMTLKKSTLRRVPVLSRADWHQDGAFLGQGIRTLNVWLALTHCGEDAPGLDVVPRRLEHIAETGTQGATFEWSVGADLVAELAGDAGVVRPIFDPGDVLLFDELFLHRTATDERMTRERHAIENWFFAPSLYPADHIPFVW